MMMILKAIMMMKWLWRGASNESIKSLN